MRPLKTPTIQWVPDNLSKIHDYYYEPALLVEPNRGPFHTNVCAEKITRKLHALEIQKIETQSASRNVFHSVRWNLD